MKPLGRLSFFVLLCLFVSICSRGATQQAKLTATVTIEVTDPTGAPIPGARTRIVPYPYELSRKLETDTNGRVAVELTPGEYEVFVLGQGFTPKSERFAVSDAGGSIVKVSLQVGSYSGPEISQVLPFTGDAKKVEEREDAYWKFVKELDIKSFQDLWHEKAIAWRNELYYLHGKNEASAWLEENRNRRLHLEEFTRSAYSGILVTGDTAVTYYYVTALWVDDLGRGTPRHYRLSHTWIKNKKTWRIVGEMTASEAWHKL